MKAGNIVLMCSLLLSQIGFSQDPVDATPEESVTEGYDEEREREEGRDVDSLADELRILQEGHSFVQVTFTPETEEEEGNDRVDWDTPPNSIVTPTLSISGMMVRGEDGEAFHSFQGGVNFQVRGLLLPRGLVGRAGGLLILGRFDTDILGGSNGEDPIAGTRVEGEFAVGGVVRKAERGCALFGLIGVELEGQLIVQQEDATIIGGGGTAELGAFCQKGEAILKVSPQLRVGDFVMGRSHEFEWGRYSHHINERRRGGVVSAGVRVQLFLGDRLYFSARGSISSSNSRSYYNVNEYYHLQSDTDLSVRVGQRGRIGLAYRLHLMTENGGDTPYDSDNSSTLSHQLMLRIGGDLR